MGSLWGSFWLASSEPLSLKNVAPEAVQNHVT